MIKQKGKEWLMRYLPAEIAGTITAVLGASMAKLLYANPIMIAYVGSLSEAFGFYGTVIIQNLVLIYSKKSRSNPTFLTTSLGSIFKEIILEFGPAGLFDGLLMRPFFLYLFPMYIKNFTLGILVGKIAGDVMFYVLVILSYELRKKYKKTIK